MFHSYPIPIECGYRTDLDFGFVPSLDRSDCVRLFFIYLLCPAVLAIIVSDSGNCNTVAIIHFYLQPPAASEYVFGVCATNGNPHFNEAMPFLGFIEFW